MLVCSGLTFAQMKQIVTANGERVNINTNPITKANNGLAIDTTGTQPKIQLGGKLIQPTTITTTSANLLEIKGAKTGAIKITDTNELQGRVLISDANGVGTWEKNTGGQKSLYTKFSASPGLNMLVGGNGIEKIPGVGSFTASVTGKYQIIFHSFLTNTQAAGVKAFYFGVYKGSTELYMDETYSYIQTYFNTHLSRVIDLNAGDVIDFVLYSAGSSLALSTLSERNQVEVIYLGT